MRSRSGLSRGFSRLSDRPGGGAGRKVFKREFFDVPGTYASPVPSEASIARVYAWGAGGSGGFSYNASGSIYEGGAAGGGAFAYREIDVSGGSIAVTVGDSGVHSSQTVNPAHGLLSQATYNGIVTRAAGGRGGVTGLASSQMPAGNRQIVGGLGGRAADSLGDVVRSGGNGGTFNTQNNPRYGTGFAGEGGGSGGGLSYTDQYATSGTPLVDTAGGGGAGGTLGPEEGPLYPSGDGGRAGWGDMYMYQPVSYPGGFPGGGGGSGAASPHQSGYFTSGGGRGGGGRIIIEYL